MRRARPRLHAAGAWISGRVDRVRATVDPHIEIPDERRLRFANRFSLARVTGSGPDVSLTSYGERLSTVHLAIESIARGEVKPRALYLWIDDPERLATLPRSLRRLQRRGLTIGRSDPYGPHTKYYPYLLQVAEPAAPLVTADDDIVYPRSWLEGLAAAAAAAPDQVHCYRAHRIRIEDGRIAPYLSWHPCLDTVTTSLNFPTGVSGVIYPPSVLRQAKAEGTAFLERCPAADDVWLHHCAVAAGAPARQVTPVQQHFPMIEGSQVVTLMSNNTYSGGNDGQIRRTYTASDVAVLVAAAAAGQDRVR